MNIFRRSKRLVPLIVCAIITCCAFSVKAEQNSFLKEQVVQINKVIADNSTGPNDPKAAFSLNEKDKILTLVFERNMSLAGQNQDAFAMIAAMLPNSIIQTVYITSKEIVNGAVLGSKFIDQLQRDGYKIKVIVKGTDKQFEFEYSSSILSVK